MISRLSGSLALIAALGLGTLPAAADDMAGAGAKVFALNAQNGSGETGTVTLVPQGDSTMVLVSIVGAPGDAQPAHVHTGSCDKLGGVVDPLTNVSGGFSMTTVKAPIAKLVAGGMAVNVHKSTSDLKDYVACANLGGGAMGGKM